MDGKLSQEEINALFSGMDIEEEPANTPSGASQTLLTPEEKDAIGEISNISLGSSATAPSTRAWRISPAKSGSLWIMACGV